MALLQGAAMPAIDTAQTQSTQAPSWYTDYLQNIAQTGTNAAQSAQFAGVTPLQQQSYDLASANVGNYQPDLNTANGDLGQVGNYNAATAGAGALQSALGQNATGAAQPYLNSAANPTYNTVQNYMNPYTQDVVSQIGDLAQQNIMQNVAPQANAGIVGSGQFGSQRGAQALGQTLANYGQQTTAAQTGALQTGYTQAMTAAQAQNSLNAQIGQTLGNLTNTQQSNLANIGQVQGNQASQEMQNLTNAAQIGGSLATTTQNLGLGDVNALNTLGTQQQQINQAQQLFPLQVAQSQAGLLQGAQIPTSSLSTYSGPIPGAYQNSGLATGLGTLASIGSLFSGTNSAASGISNLFGTSANQTALDNSNYANNASSSLGMSTNQAVTGGLMDSSGNLTTAGANAILS